MGVRFACHNCGHRLNIKSELAGRRGKCPSCGERLRIPKADSEFSTPLDEPQPVPSNASPETPSPAGMPEPAADEAAAPRPTEQTAIAAATPVESLPAQPTRYAIIDEEPHALWYVRPKTGGQYGPAAVDLLYEWIEEGRVGTAALLWREGWNQWRGAEEVLPEKYAPAAPAIPQSAPATETPAPTASATPAPEMPPTVVDHFEAPGTPASAPEPSPGVVRSRRKSRRVLLISLLLAACILLIGALLFAVSRA